MLHDMKYKRPESRSPSDVFILEGEPVLFTLRSPDEVTGSLSRERNSETGSHGAWESALLFR